MRDTSEQLRRLRRMASMSETTGLLMESLAARLADHRPADLLLEGLLDQFVSIELQYHAAVGNFEPAAAVTNNETVVALARRREAWLAQTSLLLGRFCLSPDRRDPRAISASVLLASVCRARGDLQGAIHALRAVLDTGLDDPVLDYALGMTLLGAAHARGSRVEELARDTLLEAVSALEAGLRGTPFDTTIYQAMSVCLERAGFAAAARDARSSASDADEDLIALRAQPPAIPEGIADYLRSSQALADLTQGSGGEAQCR